MPCLAAFGMLWPRARPILLIYALLGLSIIIAALGFLSLFFILGSIWLAERQQPLGAWLMLALGAFTRPQMFVLAFLLGLVYLRKFGFTRNLSSISWTVILCFIALGPFAVAISPSLPVDYVVRTLVYHVGNGQADVAYLGISPGNYSISTLPLLLVSGLHGLDRMWAPSTLSL